MKYEYNMEDYICFLKSLSAVIPEEPVKKETLECFY